MELHRLDRLDDEEVAFAAAAAADFAVPGAVNAMGRPRTQGQRPTNATLRAAAMGRPHKRPTKATPRAAAMDGLHQRPAKATRMAAAMYGP